MSIAVEQQSHEQLQAEFHASTRIEGIQRHEIAPRLAEIQLEEERLDSELLATKKRIAARRERLSQERAALAAMAGRRA